MSNYYLLPIIKTLHRYNKNILHTESYHLSIPFVHLSFVFSNTYPYLLFICHSKRQQEEPRSHKAKTLHTTILKLTFCAQCSDEDRKLYLSIPIICHPLFIYLLLAHMRHFVTKRTPNFFYCGKRFKERYSRQPIIYLFDEKIYL